MQAVTAPAGFGVPLANGDDDIPEIVRVFKVVVRETPGGLPYLLRLHLLVEDASEHEFVGGLLVCPSALEVGQPRPTDTSRWPVVKKQFADALMFIAAHAVSLTLHGLNLQRPAAIVRNANSAPHSLRQPSLSLSEKAKESP